MTFAAPLEAKSIRFRARSFVAFTLTPEAPLVAWLEGLDHWIGNSPGYFCGRPVLLDLNVLKPVASEIAALVAELATRGIRIYAIELEGASLGVELPPVLVGAKEATTDGLLPGRKASAEVSSESEGKAEEAQKVAWMQEVREGQGGEGKVGASKADESEPQVAPAQEASGTLMIKTPIRSGQAIVHPHGDVIVLGSVASGSEIIAAGPSMSTARCAAALRRARWATKARASSAARTRPSFWRSTAGTSPPRRWIRAASRSRRFSTVTRCASCRSAKAVRPLDQQQSNNNGGIFMGKVVVVTSGKGGVGKTTSTAALGAAVAKTGKKVALIDFDVGLRNLDLIMGAERRVVFDLVNVTQGLAKLSQALIRDKRVDTLFLLPASQTRDKDALTEEGVGEVIESCARCSTMCSATARPASSAARSSPCALPTRRSSSPIRK